MNTPTPNVMAAAEEIAEIAAQDPCNLSERDDCDGDCKACLTKRFAAIITRHNAGTERTLKVAAKDLAEYGGGCPWRSRSRDACRKNPKYRNEFVYEQAAQCWLEYWKKEAERWPDGDSQPSG